MSTRAAFGRFALDLESGALTRDGVGVRLQPQPAKVLVLLVRQANSIVTRETLEQQIWPDGTHVDFERGLNFCIAQVRSALGDSAEAPRYIETLPRRGYRFVAPVTISEPAPQAAVAGPSQAQAQPDRRLSWVSIAGLSLLALVTAGLLAATRLAVAVDRPVRVAVVPFDNETGMDDYDRIARAVADATVAHLAAPARIGRISVIGNAAALHQPRRFRDLKRIGLDLDADYIVLAQMKRDASQVRLIAHLIRVSDESHLWAKTFDAPEFTLDVQSQIAETIAASVTTVLTPASSPRRRS
jgi:DNA-binding winged helix-turn-helix (wHTH) protein/TolB-like protein